MKKTLLLINLLIVFFSFQISAQENDFWWMNQRIDKITFEGLQNVTVGDLSAVTAKYVNNAFTEELFTELQAELYSLQYFSYFSAKAEKSGTNNNDLNIVFNVKELPIINTLKIDGESIVKEKDIIEAMDLSIGAHVTNAKIKADEGKILDLYIKKGFIDAQVSNTYETDANNNKIDLVYTIVEGKQSKISTIAFRGNTHFSESTLKRLLTSKAQSLFSQGNYIESNKEQDIAAIKKYYSERGYLDIKVKDVEITQDESSDDLKKLIIMTFVLDEGPRWNFNAIEVSGNTIFSDEQIQKLITHVKGTPVNSLLVQQNIAAIADLYYNDGYIYNNITTNIVKNEKERLVTYQVSIDEKGQAFVEDIIIKGNEKTKDYVLQREIEIKKGDVFSKADLISSAQNLYNTGIIENVDFNVLYGSEEGKIVLEFTVIESNKVDLQFGATFGGSDEFPVSGFLSWTDKNFTGTGQDFSLSTNISPNTQKFDITFKEDWLMGVRWDGAVNLSFDRSIKTNILQDVEGVIFNEDDYNNGLAAPDPYNSYAEYQAAIDDGLSIDESYLMSYLQYSIGFGLSTGYTFMTDFGRLGINGSGNIGLKYVDYDQNLYRPYNPTIRANDENWLFSNTVGISFAWDGRDLINNPTSGYLFTQSLIYAGGVLFGESNYIKTATSLAGFKTLFSIPTDNKPIKGVLSAKSTVSWILPQYYKTSTGWDWGVSATQYEKLYIDGMNIARGWETLYDLEFLWDTSLEFSMPISEQILWAEAFISGTGYKSNYDEIHTLGINDFKFSSGIGIRLSIPGFPLGLYLTKGFEFDSNNNFVWQEGSLFTNVLDGFKLVLAITSNLY